MNNSALKCVVGLVYVAVASWLSVARAADGLAYRPIPGASPEPIAATGPTDKAELEGFMDGLMAMQLMSKPAAGAVVAVVKDGEIFFAKGYGHADVEGGIAVVPERTLFRPGSTGKLFTWTAVMQLVEQGKLDLDADINSYLDRFQLPATQPAPMTLRNLMTHTAGFEEGYLGYLMARSDQEYVPLVEFLRNHIPARVRAPTTDFADGTAAAYSNWGAALAGHIVETVSGLPFDDYVEQRIFQPLGMTSSTFREPLPPKLAARMSRGYELKDGAFEPQPFERWHNDAPAGSSSVTAIDMARFMLAHLQEGALGEARILQPETARLMHARALSPGAALDGMNLGFFEAWINGRRIIGHDGSTLQFKTGLTLIPEARLGLFVSLNTATAGEAPGEIQRAFMDHYFPATLPKVTPRPGAAARVGRFAGTYRTLRRSYRKFDKVLSAAETFSVEAAADGTLFFAHPLVTAMPGPAHWVEVGEGIFRHPRTAAFVAFKAGGDGRMYLVGPDPMHPYDRMAWYEEPRLHLVVLGLAALLSVSTLVGAVRRRRDPQLPWARPLLALAGALLIAFPMALATMLSGDLYQFIMGFPSPALVIALTLPLIAILPVAAAVVFAGIAWRQRTWTLVGRLHYTAATLAALASLLVLNYWNLLGYRFG